jgi:hypothetical protein
MKLYLYFAGFIGWWWLGYYIGKADGLHLCGD